MTEVLSNFNLVVDVAYTNIEKKITNIVYDTISKTSQVGEGSFRAFQSLKEPSPTLSQSLCESHCACIVQHIHDIFHMHLRVHPVFLSILK